MARHFTQNVHRVDSGSSVVTMHSAGHGKHGSFAETTLHTLANSAAWIAMDGGLDSEEMYHRYEIKLGSYRNNLGLFLVTTLPLLALSVPVSLLWRGTRMVHRRATH